AARAERLRGEPTIRGPARPDIFLLAAPNTRRRAERSAVRALHARAPAAAYGVEATTTRAVGTCGARHRAAIPKVACVALHRGANRKEERSEVRHREAAREVVGLCAVPPLEAAPEAPFVHPLAPLHHPAVAAALADPAAGDEATNPLNITGQIDAGSNLYSSRRASGVRACAVNAPGTDR